jgi:hypothetical protein
MTDSEDSASCTQELIQHRSLRVLIVVFLTCPALFVVDCQRALTRRPLLPARPDRTMKPENRGQYVSRALGQSRETIYNVASRCGAVVADKIHVLVTRPVEPSFAPPVSERPPCPYGDGWDVQSLGLRVTVVEIAQLEKN